MKLKRNIALPCDGMDNDLIQKVTKRSYGLRYVGQLIIDELSNNYLVAFEAGYLAFTHLDDETKKMYNVIEVDNLEDFLLQIKDNVA